MNCYFLKFVCLNIGAFSSFSASRGVILIVLCFSLSLYLSLFLSLSISLSLSLSLSLTCIITLKYMLCMVGWFVLTTVIAVIITEVGRWRYVKRRAKIVYSRTSSIYIPWWNHGYRVQSSSWPMPDFFIRVKSKRIN